MISANNPPSRTRRWAGPLALALCGAASILLALLVTGASIERALHGEPAGNLAWGPTLFRLLLAFHGLVLLGLAMWRAKGPPSPRDRAPSSDAARDHEAGAFEHAALWVTALLVIALSLRLFRLDTGLWIDEVFTLVDFIRLPLGEIVTTFPSQNQHMLYSILARLSVSQLGETAAAIRLPAALFGVAGIWALYRLGRQVGTGLEAFLAAALTTFSYHHVWFSQNARGYSGLLFFSILSTWLWLRALEIDPARSGRWWAGYSASLVLGLWIHMTMLFVIAAHGIVYLVEQAGQLKSASGDVGAGLRARRWRPIVAWLAAGSLSLQVYALALPEFLRVALHEESAPSEWTSLGWVIRESLLRLREAGLGALLLPAGAAVLALGWLDLRRRNWRAAVAFVLPAVLGGGAMVALGHNLWPRFFFFCMGFALLIAVRGAMVLARLLFARLGRAAGSRLPARVGVAAVSLVIFVSAATLPRAYALPKQDFAGALELVEREREPGDAVVAVGLAAEMFSRYFAPDWPTAASEEELNDLQSRHQRVWLVYTLPIHMRAWHPDLWRRVEQDFEPIRTFPGTLGDGEIYVCRTRSDPESTDVDPTI